MQCHAPPLAQASQPRVQPVHACPGWELPAALGCWQLPRTLPGALSTHSPMPHGSCLPRSALCVPWPLLPRRSMSDHTGGEESMVQGLALFAPKEEQHQQLSTPWGSPSPRLRSPGFSEQSAEKVLLVAERSSAAPASADGDRTVIPGGSSQGQVWGSFLPPSLLPLLASPCSPLHSPLCSSPYSSGTARLPLPCQGCPRFCCPQGLRGCSEEKGQGVTPLPAVLPSGAPVDATAVPWPCRASALRGTARACAERCLFRGQVCSRGQN